MNINAISFVLWHLEDIVIDTPTILGTSTLQMKHHALLHFSHAFAHAVDISPHLQSMSHLNVLL